MGDISADEDAGDVSYLHDHVGAIECDEGLIVMELVEVELM